MATNRSIEPSTQSVERPSPPPPEALGLNFPQLAIYSAVLLVITGIFLITYWYGYVFYPFAALSDDVIEPLREEIPLEVMPALPQQLADFYDGLNGDQQELLETYGAADVEDTRVRIPLDVAIDLVLEEGLPVADETAQADTE